MAWQSIEIIIEVELEEPLSDLLLEHGALSVTTTAADETEIFEVDGQVDDSWKSIQLTGLFDESIVLGPLLAELSANPDVRINITSLEDKNWERAWLDNFVPIQINNKLWIIPSWHENVDNTAINIQIDPGMSFGTGTHESTQLCLGWLTDLDLVNKSLIDYGCGSGILAIAGLKLGARRAVATDIEPRSLSATLENAKNNQVSEKLSVYLPDQLPAEKANIVIANILATTIIELKDILINLVADNGQILLAGILQEQQAMIRQAIPEFSWQVRQQAKWIALLGEK